MNQNIKADLLSLKKEYERLPWYKRLFFSQALGNALENMDKSEPSSTQAWAVFNAYMHQTWFFQRWFFSCLYQFSNTAVMHYLKNSIYSHLFQGNSAQANFDAMVQHMSPRSVDYALKRLQEAGLLSGDSAHANFVAVLNHIDFKSVVSALTVFSDDGLLKGDLAQSNFVTMIKHNDPYFVASALVTLQKAGLLSGEQGQVNRDVVVKHNQTGYVASALETLQKVGLLSGDSAQANFDALVNAPNKVAIALQTLREAGLLTRETAQEYFDLLIEHSAILIINEVLYVPSYLLRPEHFQAMVPIAQTNRENTLRGQEQIVRYINRNILNVNELGVGEFNANQSTHTFSVHQSVSESAKQLMDHYGEKLSGGGLNQIMDEASHWCNHLNLSNYSKIKQFKLEAAQRCLNRVLADNYHFTDPASDVSTKEMLALCWLAIHDDSKRQGSLDDAKMQFVEGLYEIQRGYNLSEQGVDDKEEDSSICLAGTFNKLVEKLQGIHPGVEVRYITQVEAFNKFPIVVKEEAKTYLNTLVKHHSGIPQKIWDELQENGVDVIWDPIKEQVKARILDEFHSLYEEGKSAKFAELMDSRGHVDMSNVLKGFKPIAEPAVTNEMNPNAFFQPPSDDKDNNNHSSDLNRVFPLSLD